MGGESLCVAQNAYAVNWFAGRELNMVFGLQLSFSRVVSELFSLSAANLQAVLRMGCHCDELVMS